MPAVAPAETDVNDGAEMVEMVWSANFLILNTKAARNAMATGVTFQRASPVAMGPARRTGRDLPLKPSMENQDNQQQL
jgi:hypothetical protein